MHSQPEFIKGHTGEVMFDGFFVTIRRSRFLGRASVGKGEKRIPLTSISAVQFKPAGPIVNGFIEFSLAGGNEGRSAFGSQTTEAARNENAVVFHYGQRAQFEWLRDQVERAIRARHFFPSQQQTAFPQLAMPVPPPRPQSPPPQGPPPGWYQDPSGAVQTQRWWDGYRYTEHIRPTSHGA
jgi:hypothetical protein